MFTTAFIFTFQTHLHGSPDIQRKYCGRDVESMLSSVCQQLTEATPLLKQYCQGNYTGQLSYDLCMPSYLFWYTFVPVFYFSL